MEQIINSLLKTDVSLFINEKKTNINYWYFVIYLLLIITKVILRNKFFKTYFYQNFSISDIYGQVQFSPSW